jgi:hypothetical protein
MERTRLDGGPTGHMGVDETNLLEHLSIAFSSDARYFFRDVYPDCLHGSTIQTEWPYLKMLALTSQAHASQTLERGN